MKTPYLTVSICASLLAFSMAAPAISPGELRQKLAAGEKLTIIDLRATGLFKQGHIPNAINIPATLVAQKQLPPLGQVVVYDDGLGPDTAQAAAALNRKPGISAQVLDGGLAAWETAHAATTQAGGLHHEDLPFITYDRLKQMPAPEVVLMDLRQGVAGTKTQAPAQATTAAPALTDLHNEFPNFRVVRSLAEAATAPQPNVTGAAGPPPLLVLIDDGGATAQTLARTLKAGGNKRFVILAGGEQILARHGQTGLQRSGFSFRPVKQAANSASSTH